jgi:hypothetical protein
MMQRICCHFSFAVGERKIMNHFVVKTIVSSVVAAVPYALNC